MNNAVIIGGGIAGYTAALECAGRGCGTILVEERELGGVCLNRGCIPTKTMLYYLGLCRKLEKAAKEGILEGSVSVSLQGLQAYTRQKIEELRYGMRYRLKKAGVKMITARACAETDRSISLSYADGKRGVIPPPEILIHAEGADWKPQFSRPVLMPEDLLTIDEVPESIAVLGGGVTGVECAMILAGLGSRVSLYEIRSSILPHMDEEARELVECQLAEAGVAVCTDWIGKPPGGMKVLWCAGSRKPEISRTRCKGEYDIGDMREDCSLASTARNQAVRTVQMIFGETDTEPSVIPEIVYAGCPVAQVGEIGPDKTGPDKSKRAAAEGKSFYYENGIAAAMGEASGFVKMYADPVTKELRKIVIAGEGADLMIGEAALLVQNHMTADQLKNTVHPHPSLCEALAECVAQL